METLTRNHKWRQVLFSGTAGALNLY